MGKNVFEPGAALISKYMQALTLISFRGNKEQLKSSWKSETLLKACRQPCKEALTGVNRSCPKVLTIPTTRYPVLVL